MLGVVYTVAVAEANEGVRQKRTWLPSLFGAQPQSVIEEAVATFTQPEAAGRIPYYPNLYNGVHYVPFSYPIGHPYNGQRVINRLTGPVIVADHRLSAPHPAQVNQPTLQTYQPIAPSLPINRPVESVPQVADQTALPAVPNVSSTELIQLAREYGVTDFSKLPSLEEVGNLLGSTTPEDTIATIRDIASTEDGRNFIRSFIESRSADNEVSASEHEETVVEPDSEQNAADDMEESETVLVQQYLDSFGAPLNSLESGATSAVKVANDEAVTATPYPGTLSRISQWMNFLNPFALRREIPIPSIDTEPTDQPLQASTVVTTTATASASAEDSASQQTVTSSPLAAPATVPHTPAIGQPIRRLPVVPFRYQYPAYFVANGGQPGGRWVQLRPTSGQIQKLPADQTYFNNQPNQLRLMPLSPVPQALAPVNAPSTVPLPPAQTPSQTPFLTNQISSEVESLNAKLTAQSDAHPIQTTTQTPVQNAAPLTQKPIHVPDSTTDTTEITDELPAQLIVNTIKDQESVALPAAQPISTAAAPNVVPTQQNAQHLPSAQSSKQFVTVPNTQTIPQLPGTFLPNTFQYPAQQFFQVPFVWGPTTYPFQTPSQHIGQLPLIDAATNEVFKNAPQLLTSYDVPVVPSSVAPVAPATGTLRASPLSSDVFVDLESELRPAESEQIERKVVDNAPATETVVVTESQSQDVTESIAKNVDATTETVVEVTTDSELTSTTPANGTDTIRTATDDNDQVQASSTPTPTPTTLTPTEIPATTTTTAKSLRKYRKRLPTKDTKSAAEAVKKFQRHMPAEAQSTVRIYRASSRALDSMPFTVEHMSMDGYENEATKDNKQSTE